MKVIMGRVIIGLLLVNLAASGVAIWLYSQRPASGTIADPVPATFGQAQTGPHRPPAAHMPAVPKIESPNRSTGPLVGQLGRPSIDTRGIESELEKARIDTKIESIRREKQMLDLEGAIADSKRPSISDIVDEGLPDR